MTVVSINEAAGRSRSADLPDRVAAVLKGSAVTSAEVQALIDEAEQAAVLAEALADATRANSLDPRLSAADAKRARETALDAEWQNERLATALAGLKEKLAEAKAEEVEAKKQRDYDAAVIERDRLAEALRAFYPEAERTLAKLLPALDANERELRRINESALPKSAQYLKSAELIARGIDGWKVGVNSITSISTELVWPRWDGNPHDPHVWPVKVRW